MSARSVYFLASMAVFFIALVAAATRYFLHYRKSRRYPYGTWEDLFRRLAILDRDNIALIARDFIDETGQWRTSEDDLDLDPSQIWPLIGGMEGLESLQRNCAVLIDLVFYLQQWYPEALVLAEQLRLNAREIEWHIDRLKAAEHTGKLETSFPDYAQRAVAIYYLMTRRVLALYDHGQLPGLADLQGAL